MDDLEASTNAATAQISDQISGIAGDLDLVTQRAGEAEGALVQVGEAIAAVKEEGEEREVRLMEQAVRLVEVRQLQIVLGLLLRASVP